jgi:hypothetical protein
MPSQIEDNAVGELIIKEAAVESFVPAKATAVIIGGEGTGIMLLIVREVSIAAEAVIFGLWVLADGYHETYRSRLKQRLTAVWVKAWQRGFSVRTVLWAQA